MKKINFIKSTVLIIITLIISSCSSDSSESTGVTTGNYWPMAVNNVWNLNANGVTQQLKITGTDQFGGTTYYKFYDEGDDASLNIQSWITKKGATYYQKIGDLTTVQSGVTINMKSYELPMLRDDLAVNETWSGTKSPKTTYSYNGASGSVPVTITYTGRIIEKDAAETINGVPYDNIIKMTLMAETNVNGETSTIDSEYWFAKDIGPIRESISVDNATPTIRTLINYTLN